ncbi:stressosome-associated protein Prli42 [Bhargavaea ullalensis]|uniref:Stressosome-associated protein Prli42 n=1 Tax=Bhargavaea ullalensis TaxID=1265685 RepID=A0ABV2G9S2_9BACL
MNKKIQKTVVYIMILLMVLSMVVFGLSMAL